MQLFYRALLLALAGAQTSLPAIKMAQFANKAYGRSHVQLLGPRPHMWLMHPSSLRTTPPIKPKAFFYNKTNNVEQKAEIQRIAGKALIINAKNEVLMLREANTYAEGTN